jgi:hypothetical protein
MSDLRFSQRQGFAPVRTQLQVDSMDEPLRNWIWDIVKALCLKVEYSRGFSGKTILPFMYPWWCVYLKKTEDTMLLEEKAAIASIRKYSFAAEWHEVYDIVEHFGRQFRHKVEFDKYTEKINKALKGESAGFRYVGGKITPITSTSDIAALETALQLKVSSVQTHLNHALTLFSNRTKPDYRNSMKESISAVEALCKIITKDKNATLETALKTIGDKVAIHPTLKDAFRKLFAYSGDAEGIRHAMKDEPTLDTEDALFMLVSCSTFISYLTAKAVKAGIGVTEAL